MGIKLAVRTDFVVNTKRYKSLDEMPPEVRAAYDKALGHPAAPGASASRITFNGETYDSVDAMPAETRRLFESIMANLPHAGTPSAAPSSGSPDAIHLAPAAPRSDPALAAIEPAGLPKWLLAALAAGVGLAFWLLRRG